MGMNSEFPERYEKNVISGLKVFDRRTKVGAVMQGLSRALGDLGPASMVLVY